MSQKWEINRVSTPERIFNKIREEMAQPVGIVLFGVDGELKSEVISKVLSSLPGIATSTNAAPTPVLAEYIQSHDVVAVMLTPEESAVHGLRHELVEVMRNAGAKTVIGVYAKAKPEPIRPLMSSPEKLERNKQIATIEQSHPTADGLDYLIVVEEEE